MNHPGEIAGLISIASPERAMVNRVGGEDIEFLGSREGIGGEKAIVAESVHGEGTVVLNADDDFADWIAGRCRAQVVMAGFSQGQIRAVDIKHGLDGEEFTVITPKEELRVRLPVPGEHMVHNALQAIGIGLVFGLSLPQCAVGLAKTALPSGRLQDKALSGISIVNDAYNANPDSMIAALRTLANLPTNERRVAGMGASVELA